jgi:hypothetical protein
MLVDPIGKAEAMRLLGIAPATMSRLMKSGELKCERTGPGKFDPILFERAHVMTLRDARFLDKSPVAQPTPPATPPTPAPKRNAAPSKVGHYEDEPTFVEAYIAGDATDSCGNTIYGGNEQWPQTGATLLGPVVPVVRPPAPGPFAHMDDALLGGRGTGVDGAPIFDASSDNTPMNAALIAQGKLQPTAPAKKASTQQQKEANDILAIRSAWRRGESR